MVVPLKHTDILDFKTFTKDNYNNFTVDVSGNRLNWLKLKVLRVEKKNPDQIQYKHNFDEEFAVIKVRRPSKRKAAHVTKTPKTLQAKYKSRLGISQKKKADLMSLCKAEIIPPIYHPFYKDMPVAKGKVDRLPLPDIEENDEVSDDE